MFLATTNVIPGYDLSENLGIVDGHCHILTWKGMKLIRQTLKAKGISWNDMSGLERVALSLLEEKALAMGADAVIGVRFCLKLGECFAYGTAVRLEKNKASVRERFEQ